MTTTHDLDDLRATLTPEELAAIDDKDPAENADALKALADEAGDEDDADDDKPGGDDSADSEGGETDAADEKVAVQAADAPAVEAADAGAQGDKPAADVGDEDEPARRPYVYNLPADFDAQVQAHRADVAELRRKRDDGEISNAEYDGEFDKLADRGAELERMRTRAETSADQQRQYEQDLVSAAWGRTLKVAAADGVDYRTDGAKHADFDGFIKVLANNPANNDKPLAWFFQEAHKRVLALHGLHGRGAAAAKPAEAKPADPKAASKAARAPDLAALPKDLAGVPGGLSAGDVGGDEFEDFDKLDGLELEDALAKAAARDPNFATKFTSGLRGNRAARH